MGHQGVDAARVGDRLGTLAQSGDGVESARGEDIARGGLQDEDEVVRLREALFHLGEGDALGVVLREEDGVVGGEGHAEASDDAADEESRPEGHRHPAQGGPAKRVPGARVHRDSPAHAQSVQSQGTHGEVQIPPLANAPGGAQSSLAARGKLSTQRQ